LASLNSCPLLLKQAEISRTIPRIKELHGENSRADSLNKCPTLGRGGSVRKSVA